MTRLDITEGNFQPLPIAMPNFIAGGPADADTARGVTQIITANLKRSGLFAPIDPAAFIERSPTSTPCRAFPTGARSMRRRSSPAA